MTLGPVKARFVAGTTSVRCISFDVLERVGDETPVVPLRWSIAHLNNASPKSLHRMKSMSVGWLMQNALYFRGEAFLGQRGAEAARLSPPIASG